MINWKVRFKNRYFWISVIPVIILLITQIFGFFGISVNLDNVSKNLVDIINTIFVLLALLGIVVDPTTDGISDSKRAMEYDEPIKDE